jgi:hypothetical protein
MSIFLLKNLAWRAPKSRGETKLKVSQNQVAESRLGSTLPASNSRKGVEGRVGSPGIRLGRDQAFRLHEPASQTNMSWLESILGPFGVGTNHGHSDSLGHTTP